MENIMSRRTTKTYKSILIILLVTAALFISTMPAYASGSEYEQGGIWANVLQPFAYYPNAEITLPETAVGEPIAEVEEVLARDELLEFASSLITGQENVVTGVYAEDVLAYPVIQQPTGSAAYVSEQNGVVTQFAMAAQHGAIGILAHNYLAGSSFLNLSIGQELSVVYGDGETAHYIIKDVRQFQALSPYSPYSDFIDLETNARYTSGSLFYEVYGHSNTLVLQTCIAAEGVDSWGRLFIIAELIY
jgi:hypothetical protein